MTEVEQDKWLSKFSDNTTPHQQLWLLLFTSRIMRLAPNLRESAIGVNCDGILQLSWRFDDAPNKTFTIDVDKSGLVGWFYRNSQTEEVFGSNSDVLALPQQAWQLLVDNFTK